MRELGFFIDKEGQIKKFGEVSSSDENKTSKNTHETSFYDEVENTDYFRKLNLIRTLGTGLYFKGIEFCLQGMILGFQSNDGSKDVLIMYIPEKITEMQKNSLNLLYKDLLGYKSYHLALYRDINHYTEYNDLEKLYQDYEIIYTSLQK